MPTFRLEQLRAELDRIDDALHDGLMRRAHVVAQVGALRAKGNVALRPGREASILRRLLRRNRGALDPATLVRVWRDILNGSTAQQQSLRIAVSSGLSDLVRDHFGAGAAIVAATDAGDGKFRADEAGAVEAVAAGVVAVAVLRWPGDWWPSLLQRRATAVNVVARLPFWAGADEDRHAMVLTAAEPDPSGEDRSLVAAPGAPATLATALVAGGLMPTAPIVAAAGCALAEVAGFVAASDTRLAGLPRGTTIVGAYAVPVGHGA